MKKLIFISCISLILCAHKILGQNPGAGNVPAKTTSRTPVAEGPDVWGVFDGRVSCQEMATEIKVQVPYNCEKLKWVFTFYQDPQTKQPGKYKLRGSLYREKVREGKWVITKGTNDNPDATVIRLDPDKPEQSIFILKGDDNVLFILGRNKKLMVGGDYLSYTFNRVVN